MAKGDWDKARTRVKAEYRPLLDAARAAGWGVDPDRGYVTLYPTNRQVRAIPVPSTPGKGRALANFKAQLRRAGLEV